MKIIYATTNEGKKEQVQSFLEYNHYNVEIATLKDIGFNEEIDENGETFEENSLIKALAVKEFCNKNNIKGIVVADDAGLMVDVLNRKTRCTVERCVRRPCTSRSRFRQTIK